MTTRKASSEEMDLIVAGIDLLIDRGEKHYHRKGWGPERRSLEAREIGILRELRADLRIGRVSLS